MQIVYEKNGRASSVCRFVGYSVCWSVSLCALNAVCGLLLSGCLGAV